MKIPVSGFVTVAGRVSICEQVASFLQLQMSLLDPRTVKKKMKRGKERMNKDSQLSFHGVGAFPTLKGIPVPVEGTLLLTGSLQLHQIELALCKWLYKDIVRQFLH